MQPIETLEEYEQARQQVDLSAHEPVIVEADDDADDMEAFDRSH